MPDTVEQSSLIYKSISAKVDDVDLRKRTVVHLITTEDVDLEGEVMIARGIDRVKSFEKSRSVFLNHNHAQIVGKSLWVNLAHNDRALLAKTLFAKTARGDEWLELYRQEMVSGWSVGVMEEKAYSGRATKQELQERPEWANARRIIRRSVLAEYSVAPIPCNPHVGTLAVSKGLLTARTAELLGWTVESSPGVEMDWLESLTIKADDGEGHWVTLDGGQHVFITGGGKVLASHDAINEHYRGKGKPEKAADAIARKPREGEKAPEKPKEQMTPPEAKAHEAVKAGQTEGASKESSIPEGWEVRPTGKKTPSGEPLHGLYAPGEKKPKLEATSPEQIHQMAARMEWAAPKAPRESKPTEPPRATLEKPLHEYSRDEYRRKIASEAVKATEQGHTLALSTQVRTQRYGKGGLKQDEKGDLRLYAGTRNGKEQWLHTAGDQLHNQLAEQLGIPTLHDHFLTEVEHAFDGRTNLRKPSSSAGKKALDLSAPVAHLTASGLRTALAARVKGLDLERLVQRVASERISRAKGEV